MTGLPGTGKSAVAEAVARALPAPVFSVDPLEAVLLRAGIDREHRSDYAAYDLAASLAGSQLQLGQSAVVDAVNPWERLRRWFLGLAEPVGAPAVLIETICSDQLLHRARFENRDRRIDGWVHEPTWQDVERHALEYESSCLERLALDGRSARREPSHCDRLRDGAALTPTCRSGLAAGAVISSFGVPVRLPWRCPSGISTGCGQPAADGNSHRPGWLRYALRNVARWTTVTSVDSTTT